MSGASSSRKVLDDPSTDAHQELLTEHFGFHPRVFVDALVYAANEHLYSIGAQFEDFAKTQLRAARKKAASRNKKHANNPSTSSLENMSSRDLDIQAERGVHAVLTLLENALDHIFDLLELYCLKTVFGLRPSQANVLTLIHHRGLDLRTSEERVKHGLPLSVAEESKELKEREWQLRNRVEGAKRLRHALRLALISARKGQERSQALASCFSTLLDRRSDSSAHLLPPTMPQSSRKLRSDAYDLMESLQELHSTDPLGASLLSHPTSGRRRRPSDKDRREILAASGASDQEKRAWERGREAYIHWELDRIIRNVKKGHLSEISEKVPNRSITTHVTHSSPRTKRRRTTRFSQPAQMDLSEHEAAQIGDAQEVETLLEKLT